MVFRVLIVLAMLTLAPYSHGSSLSTCRLCPPGWTRWENNCYRYFHSPKRNFTDSEAFCSTFVPFEETCPSYTSHLVTIESASENAFILNWWRTIRRPNTAFQNLRIGYTDATDEGDWKWVDGSSCSYTNWDNNQPDDEGSGRDCASMSSRYGDFGKWDDQRCSHLQQFMCKFSLNGY